MNKDRRTSHTISFSDATKEALETIRKEQGLKSIGRVIDFLLKEFRNAAPAKDLNVSMESNQTTSFFRT